MRVLLSGQAALAVTLDRAVQVRPLDGAPFLLDDSGSAMRLFAGCTDVTEHTVSDEREIDLLLEGAWASDRALRLVLMIIDPTEPADELSDNLEALEELLEYKGVESFVISKMTSAVFPQPVRIEAVQEAAKMTTRAAGLFDVVFSRQPTVERVFDAYHNVPTAVFSEGENGRRALISNLTRSGEISRFVENLYSGSDLNFIRIKWVNQALSQRQAISVWADSLQKRGPTRKARQFEDKQDDYEVDDEFDYSPSARRQDNGAAYAFVRERQKFIVDLLKARELDKAREAARQLISAQRTNSTTEHIGKTLSLLAQEAKLQDIRELHLEWAEWAATESPQDPKTFGHLSDALMSLGRFEEAEKALSAAEAAGGRLFAEGGRARLLRAVGRLEEAREKYLAAAIEFHGWKEVEHVLIGAADTLIEMGRSEEAIAELSKITVDFPLATAAWSSLAAAHIDVGSIDEALISVGKSVANRKTMASLSSRADVLARAGKFEEACRIYDSLIESFPSRAEILCGSARAYRGRGRIETARTLYDLALERCPYSAMPLHGKGVLQLETGHVYEAIELFEKALGITQYYPGAMTGLLRCFLSLDRFDEVIARADRILEVHSHLISVRVVRARALYGRGEVEEALSELDQILATLPNNVVALSAKANILVRSGRPATAAPILPDVDPVTRTEWTRFVIRAIMVAPDVGPAVTIRKFQWALTKCRFFAARKLIRSALVTAHLNNEDVRAAQTAFEQEPSEVSTVVEFHVFAAARDAKRSRDLFERLKVDGSADRVIRLADEIGRRNRVLQGSSSMSPQWIGSMHADIILAEAA